MSVFAKPADIVARATAIVATSILQLDLPPMSGDPRPVQSANLFKDSHFHVLSKCKRFHAHLVVVSAIFDPSRRRRTLHCNDVNTGQPVPLDDEQLAYLEGEGRLRFLKPDVRGLPKSPLAMDEIQVAIARRYRGYVMTAIQLGFDEGKEPDDNGVLKRAIEKHAAVIHDLDPLTPKTLRKYVRELGRWHEEDMRAFLPRVSSGNRTTALERKAGITRQAAKEAEELIKSCVIAIHSQGNPRLEDLKTLLGTMLEQPEHSHLKRVLTDDNDNFRLDDSTFYRRMRSLNRYDRDREYLGKDAARNRRRTRASRPLPGRPLDIVDVDFTEPDIIVKDPRYHFIYGRPKIIMFRDRATGAVLGFAVFFENISFEAVWHGLRRAIFPKDMSKYPKWRWNMYGFMRRLVVDNEAALISDTVFQLGADLGIDVRQARVARPTDKAGLEQFFGKLKNAVIRNLPGATGKNIVEREEFDNSKEKGVPLIDLDKLDDAIVEYICTEVHATPLVGFHHDAKTSEELWEEGIGKTMNRPLFNPSEMLRVTGIRIKVTIRGGNTIVHKHIEYMSHDLGAITENRTHVECEYDDRKSSQYDAVLDPINLGKMIVLNPYDHGSEIEVPASDKWAKYANGLRRFQHEAVLLHHNTVFKSKVTGPSDLERAARHKIDRMEAMAKRVNSQKAKEQYAAFHGDMARRVVLGRVVDVPPSAELSEDFLDPENPLEAPPVEQLDAAASSAQEPTSPPEVYVHDGDGNLVREDVMKGASSKQAAPKKAEQKAEQPKKRDIEALRRKHKGWN